MIHKSLFNILIYFCFITLGATHAYSKVASNSPIPTPYFPWFEVERVSVKINGVSESILMPFYIGIATDIPLNVQNDFKPELGWELVYNYLGTETFFAVPFFAIYNKYRGILRFFYLHNKETPYSHLTFGFMINGDEPNSLINHRGDFSLADTIRTKNPFFMNMNTESLGLSGPALGQWYYFDMEVSYDSHIDSISTNTIRWDWLAQGADITNLAITGTQTGSINGKIQFSGASNLLQIGALSFSQANHTTTGPRVNVTNSSGNKDSMGSSLEAKIIAQSKSSVAKEIGKLSGKLVNGVTEYLSSPFSSIFKSFVGGSTSSEGDVSLMMDTKIELNGTLTLKQPIFNQTLKIPGTSYTNTDNVIIPHYDKPLGIFNLSRTPKLLFSNEIQWIGHRRPYGRHIQTYSLISDSIIVVINPAIQDEIEIEAIDTRLLYYTNYTGPTEGIGNFIYSGPLASQAQVGHIQIDSDPDFTLFYGGSTSQLLFDFKGVVRSNTFEEIVHKGIVVEVTVRYRPKGSANLLAWSHTYVPEFVKEIPSDTCVTSNAAWNALWKQGTTLSTDNKILGHDIIKYRIQWFSGGWSKFYYPGYDDIDWVTNQGNQQRRVWSYFYDHNFEYCH